VTYIPEESKAVYQSKDGKDEKVFDPLEWIAAMCWHLQHNRRMIRALVPHAKHAKNSESYRNNH